MASKDAKEYLVFSCWGRTHTDCALEQVSCRLRKSPNMFAWPFNFNTWGAFIKRLEGVLLLYSAPFAFCFVLFSDI